METLTRKGMLDNKSYGLIDNLSYSYNGNQVVKVTDKVQGPYYKDAMHFVDGANAAIEYKYNKNGCMTQDLNKNILGIDYNLLNLPTKVTFSDGSVIAYCYDADGAKISADYNLSLMNVTKGTNGTTQAGGTVKHHRDYCGNYIYEDGALKMLLFEGGFDGKDPGDFFKTMDEAALDFALNYNVISIQNNLEYAASIICVNDEDGNIGYTYSMPIEGTDGNSKPQLHFSGHAVAATVHSHAAYNKPIQGVNTCDYFTGQVAYNRNGKLMVRTENELRGVRNVGKKISDVGSANATGIKVYVATPSGNLQMYNPQNGKISMVSTKIPSDKNDPWRLNNISIYPFGRNMDSFKCMNNFFRLMSNPVKLKRK